MSSQKIVVLRWGHRPQRDARLTTHVALTARALGASGFVLSDTEDKKIQETVEKIRSTWGGQFSFEMGTKWKHIVRDWKSKGGVIVHLTAYGENIQARNVLEKIKSQGVTVKRNAEAIPTLSFFVIFLTKKYTAIMVPREYKTAGSLSVTSFDPKSLVRIATLYI